MDNNIKNQIKESTRNMLNEMQSLTYDGKKYDWIRDQLELSGDEEGNEVNLYVNTSHDKPYYITKNPNTGQIRKWKGLKHPSELAENERRKVLRYVLGRFDENESVDYSDLFIQGEYIVEL